MRVLRYGVPVEFTLQMAIQDGIDAEQREDWSRATFWASIAVALAIGDAEEIPESELPDPTVSEATLSRVYGILHTALRSGPRHPAISAAVREIEAMPQVDRAEATRSERDVT